MSSPRPNSRPKPFRARISGALGLMSDLKLIVVEVGSLAIVVIWMFHEVAHALVAK